MLLQQQQQQVEACFFGTFRGLIWEKESLHYRNASASGLVQVRGHSKRKDRRGLKTRSAHASEGLHG
ncbi:hypothetical protein BRADI_2g47215v3 [Brachypodium distachyon]|uniref:Uncharacterized protein n=1 Tax=Brachypodium distachyon TaxID=15368 RepID=A0A0Q3JAC1_BRADI|nr:hypothetical protein BRADI_2g47215v3 [Brachypodium distachyon]